MDDWVRVSEDEVGRFRPMVVQSHDPNAAYLLAIQHEPQGWVIRAECAGKTTIWAVEVLEEKGKGFRLQGMAFPLDSVLDDCYWYELLLEGSATINYYGNQVLHRSDSLSIQTEEKN